jgi:cysteine-rich repeat protein
MRLTSTVPAVLLAAVGLVGCLDAAAVTCADGTLCPVGWACDPLGCVSPEQQRACGDQLDGAPCTLAGIGAGTCTDGRCVIAVCGNERIEPGERCDDGNNFSGDGCNATCSSDELCGNGLRDDGEACDCGTDEAALPSGCDAANGAAGGTCRLDCILVGCGNGGPDPGEVCDDGNQTSGDGCSYDCASLEVCGNGYPDFAAGEQCDAGPGLSHDGCASACVAEVAAWDAVVPDGRLPPRTQLQLAVDGATGEVIAHGGVDGNARSDTWAWDGAAWRQLQANMPWPNFNSALGYHHGRGELVRFGGAEADDATYFFDGATWRREQLDPSPPVQTGGQLVWDAARAELVLVGGGPAFGPPTQETWALTGSGWTQRSTSAPPRRYTSATYDPSRAQVVMIGGYDDTDACDGTLWGWDGSAWTALPVGGPPPLVAFASLAWAPRDQQLVLFGTRCSDGVAETWVLEHDAWAVVPTTSTPLAGGRLVLDPTRGELLLAGGFDGNFTYSDTTWAWTGTDWRQRDDLNPPAVAGALAYDATRGELVMTLSTCCDAPALEVWRHDGARWHPRDATG